MLDYLKMFAPLVYNPKRQFHLPFDLSMCTRDTDFIDKMKADSRERRWASSSSLVKILLAQTNAMASVRNIGVPTLFLIAGNDSMVSTDTSINAFNRLLAKDKMLIKYPDMYHALSIDIGKERVFKDLLEWIEKRI